MTLYMELHATVHMTVHRTVLHEEFDEFDRRHGVISKAHLPGYSAWTLVHHPRPRGVALRA
jgi:hypothetical protein